MKWIWLILISLVFMITSYAQEDIIADEYFNEFELSAKLVDSEKWSVDGKVDWKHIYDEVGWRRLGVDIPVRYTINHHWSIGAGLHNYYTFDKDNSPWWFDIKK